MKTIEENNKLIAEFMGANIEERKQCILPVAKFREAPTNNKKYSAFELCYLEYNTSWDWLMPVVEKIESLGHGVTIGMGMYCVIQDDITEDGIEFTGMEDGKLLSTYRAVIEFIEWYNENK